MLRTTILTAVAALACCLTADRADAQLVTYYSPVIASPVVAAPVTTVVARPIVAAPLATVVARPIVTVAARPVTTIAYSPTVAYSPVAAPAYVSAPVVTNVPVYRTRWRPLLGGTVTTVRYRPVLTNAVVPAF